MTILLRNLKLSLDHDEADLARAAAAALGVEAGEVTLHTIVKKSLDARRRREPQFLYTLALELDPATERELLDRDSSPVEVYSPPSRVEVRELPAGNRGRPPVVVGAGPAGLFAAWRLVQAGLAPIVIERGPDVTERTWRWNR